MNLGYLCRQLTQFYFLPVEKQFNSKPNLDIKHVRQMSSGVTAVSPVRSKFSFFHLKVIPKEILASMIDRKARCFCLYQINRI